MASFSLVSNLSRRLENIYLTFLFVFCRQILDQDNFSPIPVSTEQEYRQYTSQFPLQDPELEKVESCALELGRKRTADEPKAKLNSICLLAFLPQEASFLWVCAKSLLPAERVHLCLPEILWGSSSQVSFLVFVQFLVKNYNILGNSSAWVHSTNIIRKYPAAYK